MSFTIPTLTDLINRLRTHFAGELPGADLNNPRSNIAVTAKVLGGGLWGIYGWIERIARGRFVHLAEGEDLDRHGVDWAIARNPAAPARGTVTMTATAAAEMAIGGQLRASDGRRYRVTAGADLATAGTGSVQVEAVDAGTIGNLAAAAVLTPISGLTGPATFAVAAGGLIGGVDRETDAAYQARLLARKRRPPQAGTTGDYWRWALAVDGVSDCYVWPRAAGAGTVRLYPVMDGLRANGLPTNGDLAAVAEAIDAAAPDGALIQVTAFTPVVVNVVISNLAVNTPATQEAIRAELRAVFAERGRVAGDATPHPQFPMRATPSSFSRSWIGEAISRAAGEDSHQLTSPSSDTALTPGDRAVLGTVTFS